METILDQLYEHPQYYPEVLNLLTVPVKDEDVFDATEPVEYDYRAYLNDSIRDHIKVHGGYSKLSTWASQNL